MKTIWSLSNADINSVCEITKEYLSQNGESNADIIKAVFTMEEFLLNSRDFFGESKVITLNCYKRFGVFHAAVDIKGEKFDLNENKDALGLASEEILSIISTYDNIGVNYKYINGSNRFEIYSLKSKKQNLYNALGGSLTLSIVLAIVLGILSVKFFPEGLASSLTTNYLDPFLSKLTGIINGLMGPLMAFSIISSICLIGDVTNFTNIGSRVLRRYVGMILIMIAVTAFVSSFFFPVLSFNLSSDVSFYELYTLLINVIPTNTLLPFIENETIKIVFIALFVGYCILACSKELPVAKDLVNDLNFLFAQMMRVASKIIPAIVFLNIYKTVINSGDSLGSIADAIVILAANFIAVVGFVILQLIYMSLTKKVNIIAFLKAISKPYIIALTTASTTMANAANMEACRENLKIEPKLVNFWLSLTHALFNPSIVFPIVVAAFYGTFYSHSTMSLTQFVILIILTIQLSIASPKVQGGIVAVFTILVSQLGLQEGCIGALVTANIVHMYIHSGFSIIIRDCELLNLYKSGKVKIDGKELGAA